MNYYFTEIKRAFEMGEVVQTSIFNKPIDCFVAIGTATDILIYKNDYANELQIIFNSIYSKEKIINQKIAFNNFAEHISSYIFEQKMNSLGVGEDGIKKMFDEMYNKEIKSYSVFTDVYGVQLEDKTRIYNMSVFNIYYWPITKIEIEKRIEGTKEILWLHEKHEYLIETTVEAADTQKALELATSLFEKFQYFMHVAIGLKDKRINVTVNIEKFIHPTHTLLLCNGMITKNLTMESLLNIIPIDSYFAYNDPIYGYDAMWNLLTVKVPNEFQKRLILALEWLGQAYRDNSLQNSFLKAMISLEIIFTYNEETIITPSILHQISESAALILGSNADECIQIEHEMKKLYSKRSSIVHTGNHGVDMSMLVDILNYSSCIILQLLNNKEFENIKSIKELYNLLKVKRYSKQGCGY